MFIKLWKLFFFFFSVLSVKASENDWKASVTLLNSPFISNFLFVFLFLTYILLSILLSLLYSSFLPPSLSLFIRLWLFVCVLVWVLMCFSHSFSLSERMLMWLLGLVCVSVRAFVFLFFSFSVFVFLSLSLYLSLSLLLSSFLYVFFLASTSLHVSIWILFQLCFHVCPLSVPRCKFELKERNNIQKKNISENCDPFVLVIVPPSLKFNLLKYFSNLLNLEILDIFVKYSARRLIESLWATIKAITITEWFTCFVYC